MIANPWQLSEKSLQIVTEQPPVWEHRLFAQIIIDEVEANKQLRQQDRFVPNFGIDTIALMEIALWAIERLDEIIRLINQLEALINLNHEDAFGPPGKPGDVAVITAFSREIGALHRRAIEWSQIVQSTPVDSRCIDITHELASLAESITVPIERYGPDLLQQIEEALRSSKREINVILVVEPPNTNRILEEIKRITAIFEHHATSQMSGYSTVGYLYLLVNPSMEGLVKIGKTTRNPRDRAKELGTVSGVPTPFILVFDVEVDDCSIAEEYVHTRLEEYRVSKTKEFFKVPSNEVVKVMLDAQKHVAVKKSNP